MLRRELLKAFAVIPFIGNFTITDRPKIVNDKQYLKLTDISYVVARFLIDEQYFVETEPEARFKATVCKMQDFKIGDLICDGATCYYVLTKPKLVHFQKFSTYQVEYQAECFEKKKRCMLDRALKTYKEMIG